MKADLTPEVFSQLKRKASVNKAAGLPAIVSSARHVFSNMSLYRGNKALFNLNQKGKFDCPSCAWPDPDGKRSKIAEYCENGAKAVSDEATSKKAGPGFFKKYSVKQMAAQTDYWLGQQGRITHPVVLREDSNHYEAIEWEEAFKLIAQELKSLNNPNEAVFYTSGRSSNEAAFLYQLFARQFGTNNLPDCSNMCHESSGVALKESIGIGKGTVTLNDFDDAELIVIMGQNPGTNHPRMLNALQGAKENGAKIVAINPLIETGLSGFKDPQTVKGMLLGGVSLTDLYLQVKVNGDMALLKAAMILLLEEDAKNPGKVLDTDFIKSKTSGWEALKADLKQYSVEELANDCGIAIEEIRAFVDLLANRKRIIICWAMGLTQHVNSVYVIQEVANLLLLKGSIGKKGAGVCPVRGHSNVQGDRTMGIFHLPPQHLQEKIKEIFKFDPPEDPGHDVVDCIEAMYTKIASVFIALGGNLMAAAPDTHYTSQAFRKCNLTVQISTKLNRSHLVTGKTALILPCLGRTEIDKHPKGNQILSTENSMGVIQMTQGVLSPVSNSLKSEPYIISKIAEKTCGNTETINWSVLAEEYDAIRDLISKCVKGCDDMNTKIRQDGGFYLPNGPREGKFTTEDGKAHLTVNKWQPIRLSNDEFLLMTIRSHDQFNTTIYGLNDRYRGIFNERRVLFIHPEDAQKFNLDEYDIVDIYSQYDGVERKAEKFIIIYYSIAKGCVASYFPEANPLVPLQLKAEKSNTPASKSIKVRLNKVGLYSRKERKAIYL